MKHFFLDTNVIIDIISDRKPFSFPMGRLFTLAERKGVKLYVSTLSFSNIYYVVKKTVAHKELIAILSNLNAMTEMLDVTKKVIKDALGSAFTDFEDGIQHYTALTNKRIDAIVTRNTSDYKHSEIPVLTPDEALSLVESSED